MRITQNDTHKPLRVSAIGKCSVNCSWKQKLYKVGYTLPGCGYELDICSWHEPPCKWPLCWNLSNLKESMNLQTCLAWVTVADLTSSDPWNRNHVKPYIDQQENNNSSCSGWQYFTDANRWKARLWLRSTPRNIFKNINVFVQVKYFQFIGLTVVSKITSFYPKSQSSLLCLNSLCSKNK